MQWPATILPEESRSALVVQLMQGGQALRSLKDPARRQAARLRVERAKQALRGTRACLVERRRAQLQWQAGSEHAVSTVVHEARGQAGRRLNDVGLRGGRRPGLELPCRRELRAGRDRGHGRRSILAAGHLLMWDRIGDAHAAEFSDATDVEHLTRISLRARSSSCARMTMSRVDHRGRRLDDGCDRHCMRPRKRVDRAAEHDACLDCAGWPAQAV